MMPLSSNRASIVRPASALDIFVRIASAAVSSALFTGLSFVKERGRGKPRNDAPKRSGASKTLTKPALLWDIPRKSARYRHFLDPHPLPRYPSPPPAAGPLHRHLFVPYPLQATCFPAPNR